MLTSNGSTTINASSIVCRLESCRLLQSVTCPGREPRALGDTQVLELTVGPGPEFTIETTGLPAQFKCSLVLTVSGVLPASAAGLRPAAAGGPVAGVSRVSASKSLSVKVDGTLQPPSCSGRVANVTAIQMATKAAMHCKVALKGLQGASTGNTSAAGPVFVAVQRFRDPQNQLTAISITGVDADELMPTSCRKCSGLGRAKNCSCMPAVVMGAGGASLSVLPVASLASPGYGRLCTISFSARTAGDSCTGNVQLCVGARGWKGGGVTCAKRRSMVCSTGTQRCNPTVCG